MSVPSDHAAFLDWFPQLTAIGTRCRQPIYDAMQRGGFMATGEAKVIDNWDTCNNSASAANAARILTNFKAAHQSAESTSLPTRSR
jgi:hypothetical protein